LVAINGNNAMINFYPPTLCINLSIAFSAALSSVELGRRDECGCLDCLECQ